MKWNNSSTTPPPHLITVLGWFPEFEEDDELYYQLVYYSQINKIWYAQTNCEECLPPALWTAIITPVVDDDIQFDS